MQKLIKGKRYSTSTAQRITDYGENLTNVLYRRYECLYAKNDGDLFLYASGGAMTIYGARGEDGEQIIPMTTEQARKWADAHGKTEDLEVFLSSIDPQKDVSISVKMGSWEKQKLDEAAARAGLTNSEYIRRVLWLFDLEAGEIKNGKR